MDLRADVHLVEFTSKVVLIHIEEVACKHVSSGSSIDAPEVDSLVPGLLVSYDLLVVCSVNALESHCFNR